MSKFYTTNGIIRYKDTGWVVLECGKGIGEYYRFWVKRLLGIKATRPLYGMHITIVYGKRLGSGLSEDVMNHPNWKKFDGMKVGFTYSPPLYWNEKNYFWLNVKSKKFNSIRKSLGLKPFETFHLTIGHYETR